MEAPRHITEAIYRLHNQVRLGWIGEDRLSPEEPLNKGKFALLQLYHRRDAERTFYGEPWNDRGPIFGRPVDRSRVPIMLTFLDPEVVLNGSFMCACDGCLAGMDPCPRAYCDHKHNGVLLRRWMMSMGARMIRSAEERGKVYQLQLDDLAGEMGSQMYFDSKQTGATSPPKVAKKHLTAKDKAVLGGETIKGVKNAFVNKLTTNTDPLV